MANPPLAELRQVFQHVNGHCALNDLSLAVNQGDALLLIGPNGAGKSLTLRLMVGLDHPSAGSVRLFGQDLRHLTDARMNRLRGRLGVVLQGGSLLDELTVLENLLLPMRAQAQPRARLARAARLAITQLQLDGMEHQYPRALSLGQQRRAELARALINQPELLICDGLSDGLDPPALRDILGILKVQRERRGLSIIATDNGMLEIIGPDDRVAVLDRGRLLFAGTRADLEARSRDDLALRTLFEGHP
ncbi:ABC transporter ATP-binding protein [Halochromatium salexigens]|uniref:ABC transporter n=1 Tax=Halochromatium salexigens TaxID=49447 RepID=A0AAJ0XFF2_HALSE|nr:ABC transporter ATP-binding protein [Halochromatium salexigens]MBK5930899.1 ABC transporter [Halochromatium salexigens]